MGIPFKFGTITMKALSFSLKIISIKISNFLIEIIFKLKLKAFIVIVPNLNGISLLNWSEVKSKESKKYKEILKKNPLIFQVVLPFKKLYSMRQPHNTKHK